MSTRRTKQICIAAVLLLAIAIICLCWLKSGDSRQSNSNEGKQELAQTNSGTVIGSNLQNLIAALRQTASSSPDKVERTVRSKNVPIHFWGKVFDLEGKPLDGVKVTATVRTWGTVGMAIGSSHPSMTAVSGMDGRFEIDGGKGDVLTIKSIEKEGYEPEPMALRSYGYNISENVLVSADAPIVFRMWKKADRQQLVANDKFFGIIPDGRVYTIDFLKGTKVDSATAEGDLRVKVTRPMDVKFGDHYEWSFEIEAINGGLVEESNRLADMFLAPADGYTNICRMTVERTDRSWSDMVPKNYYTKTRNGMYSRMKLEIYAFYDLNKKTGTFSISYASNPSGSRALK